MQEQQQQQPELIVGLDHVQIAIPASEEERVKAFYRDVLGLTEVPKPEALAGRGGGWYRCGAHSAEFHIGIDNAAQPQRKAHPAFLTHDLAAMRERLEATGAPIAEEVQLPGFERFFSADPFGNRLEFLQPIQPAPAASDEHAQHDEQDEQSAAIKALAKANFGASAEGYVASPIHRRRDDIGQVVAWAQPQPTDTALDISTGGGHMALGMAPHVERIVVSDLTPRMLAAAQAYLASHGVSNATYVIADAEALPFLDETFDIVTVRIAPHHYPHIRTAVREMARVLKPGGRLALVDNIAPDAPTLDALINEWDKRRDPSHVREYTVSEWLRFLSEAGLHVERHETHRRAIEYVTWVDLMRVPDDVRAKLEADILGAPPAARSFFDVVERDGRLFSFSSDFLLALAVKR